MINVQKSYLVLGGFSENLPARRLFTPEEQAERERLGQLFAGGKLISEMILEDRGPY
jgi:hypothetical protein